MDDAIKGFMEKFHSCSKNDAYLGSTPKRFRITEHDEATVFEMLKISYEGEVKKRRKILISDECTISNLKKAAKWLTGDHKFSLLLYGGVGNGKSTLSRAICVLFDIEVCGHLFLGQSLGNPIIVDPFILTRSIFTVITQR